MCRPQFSLVPVGITLHFLACPVTAIQRESCALKRTPYYYKSRETQRHKTWSVGVKQIIWAALNTCMYNSRCLKCCATLFTIQFKCQKCGSQGHFQNTLWNMHGIKDLCIETCFLKRGGTVHTANSQKKSRSCTSYISNGLDSTRGERATCQTSAVHLSRTEKKKSWITKWNWILFSYFKKSG